MWHRMDALLGVLRSPHAMPSGLILFGADDAGVLHPLFADDIHRLFEISCTQSLDIHLVVGLHGCLPVADPGRQLLPFPLGSPVGFHSGGSWDGSCNGNWSVGGHASSGRTAPGFSGAQAFTVGGPLSADRSGFASALQVNVVPSSPVSCPPQVNGYPFSSHVATSHAGDSFGITGGVSRRVIRD